MKLTTGILFLGIVAGTAWGQNPDVITNTRDTLRAVQQKQAIDSNAALAASQGNSATAAVPASASAHAAAKPVSHHKAAAAKPAVSKTAGNQVTVKAAAIPGKSQAIAKKAAPGHKKAPKQQIAVENQKKPADAKAEAPKHVSLTGRRDPFVSPVVNRSMLGSGCSTGKRCLAIDQINLKGVVKSDNGMIAVVTNSLNKAYFLRENDPVFNGYVVRITGDSIIFKETVQDRLGKPFTREVTKKITTSAV
jgi:Tfp pilus assembly protein PilP